MTDVIHWLQESDEPWTRYRTLVDLLDRPEDDAGVQAARAAMLAHPLVQGLLEQAAGWPGHPLKRHNDAKHAIYALSTLADFGLRAGDPEFKPALEAVLALQSDQGAFQTRMQLYKRFGGLEGEHLVWITCDAPTLLYVLLAAGLGEDARVQQAVDHLASLAEDNGWRCRAAPEMHSFKGPGKREDPCPLANVYALKALSLVPDLKDGPAVRAGAELLLAHWAQETRGKLFLFGTGRKFRWLKYPYIWFDILHVTEVLSRYPFVYDDPRFHDLIQAITERADAQGRYTAGSMYMAWKGWSFADKKNPSPWLTFLVTRIQRRLEIDEP